MVGSTTANLPTYLSTCLPTDRPSHTRRYVPGETVRLYENESKFRARLAELQHDPAKIRELLEHVYTWAGSVIEIIGDGT